MQIVIEIDKNLYDRLIDAKQPVFFGDMDSLYKSVVCGTPLPKNHGRLIDYSTLDPGPHQRGALQRGGLGWCLWCPNAGGRQVRGVYPRYRCRLKAVSLVGY